MNEPDCIFCKFVNREIPCVKVWEDKDFLAFLDKNPRGEGHSLVIPKQHFSTIMDLSDEISGKYISAIRETAKVLIKKYNTNSFNIVLNYGKAAGQKIQHVHFHLLPRREGDKKDLILFEDKYKIKKNSALHKRQEKWKTAFSAK